MNLKRVLSIILTLCMLLAIAQLPVLASETDFVNVVAVTLPVDYYDVSKGVTISDPNGVLSFSEPVVNWDYIAFNVEVPAGAEGKTGQIVVKINERYPVILKREIVFIESDGTLNYLDDYPDLYLEEGKTEAVSAAVSTENGVTVTDSNGILIFSTPVVGDGFVAFNATAPADSGGKVTQLEIRAKDENKTLLYSALVQIEEPALPAPPPAPAVMDKASVEGAITVDHENKAVITMPAGIDGISASAYNYLKNYNFKSITFVDAEGAYTWTIHQGDYIKMNVTASIYFGVEVSDKLYKLNDKYEVVEDTAKENAVLKALGDTRADVFYVTINDNVKIGNVAPNAELTVSVSNSWIVANNKFDISAYSFDGEKTTKVLDSLAVEPATGKLTLNLTTPGLYVFVSNDTKQEATEDYCPGYPHEYDNDDDTTCNICGYERVIVNVGSGDQGSTTPDGVYPEAPAVMNKASVEGAITVDHENKAVITMPAGVDGISAEAYNWLKNRNFKSITFEDAEGCYVWTLHQGDYVKMNVTASIYFGVEVDDKLYTLNDKKEVVEDIAKENAVLKALGNTTVDVFYLTIDDNVNIGNIAYKPELTFGVSNTWCNFNNKFNISAYSFNGKVVKKVLQNLAVEYATGNLTLTLTTPGLYVFVDGAKINDDCTAHDHQYDDDYDSICNNCGYVREALAPILPTFAVESKLAKIGETFDVAVSVENNTGIVSLKLMAGYDPEILELVSVAEKDFVDVSFGPITANPIAVNWEDVLSPNNTDNGAVAILTFKVKETATPGYTNITISYDSDDVFDENFENVPFETANGTITVIEYTPGDVNKDGTVNNKDLGILRQYLNGWEVEVDTFAADVTGDGKVNNKDLGILRQYLNGWDVELSHSPVN